MGRPDGADATARLREALSSLLGAAECAVTPVGLVADELLRQRAALRETDHRPWPLPARPWLMGQTWYDLLFAHWALAPELIRPLIPRPLELDERDGRAWLGVTPFRVAGLRGRGMAPLPWLSRFPELNVRTYVCYGGRPGIYFFSLDAARHAAVVAARRGYRLPYFHADMSARRAGQWVRYRSVRIDSSGPPAEFQAGYGPTGPRLPINDGSLERWLAERYCLYVVDDRGRTLRADIHHSPWPLQPGAAEIDVNTMAAPLGITLQGDPLLHYSARQDVLIWPLAPA
jgi:uncharacterized protein YqjF (DUF2071 family)